MCTAVWTPMIICLSELPKWLEKLWSMHLQTALWYSLSTGWKRYWSASGFWWAFLVTWGQLFHYVWQMRNMCWVELMAVAVVMKSAAPSSQWASSISWATLSPVWEQHAPVCSSPGAVIAIYVQTSWVTAWKGWILSFNHYRLAGCWSWCSALANGSGTQQQKHNRLHLFLGDRRVQRKEGFLEMVRVFDFFHKATQIFLSCLTMVAKH